MTTNSRACGRHRLPALLRSVDRVDMLARRQAAAVLAAFGGYLILDPEELDGIVGQQENDARAALVVALSELVDLLRRLYG
jgi:hypothetical protein